MKISVVVRTLFSRFLFLLILLLYAIPILLIIVLPKKWYQESKLFFASLHLFYWLVLKASFLSITYMGKENIPDEPAIIIANHESSFDVPIIGYLLDYHPHTWLATSWLMKSPLLRIILPRITLLVDTSTPITGMRSLLDAIKAVNGSKQDLVVFPEGGRFTDGNVHSFFSGFVLLAKKMGRPVVPIRIFNVNKVYPPNTFWIHNYPVRVVVGTPFVKGDREDDESFKQRVYDWFVKQK